MQLAWRISPVVVPVLITLTMAALFHVAPAMYQAVLEFWLVQYHSPPFLDAGGITSALECERLGYDTYLANPCDPLERQFVYPPIWKLAAVFPVTYSGWTPGVAAIFIAVFLVSLALLPRARTAKHAAIMTLAAVSPPVGWAINAGNNELLLFAIVAVALAFWLRSVNARLIAYAGFILAAILKYFPAALMLMAAKEAPSRAALVAVAAIATGSIIFFVWFDEWPRAFANVWNISVFTYTYGSENAAGLFSTLGLFERETADHAKWFFSGLVVLAAWRYSRRAECQAALRALDDGELAFLLGGALLIASSYLLTQNVAYRLIYLLMVLPGLLAVASTANALLLRSLPYLSLLVMFVFPLRRHLAAMAEPDSAWWILATTMGVYVREAAWLFLASGLLALVFCWVRQTETFKQMSDRLPANIAKQL